MVTKLQKAVEMVEDRHLGEAYYRETSPKFKHRRPKQFRGSVMDATPKELMMIRKLAVPMDQEDSYCNRNRGNQRTSGWRIWLHGELSNRSKNA